ncbi:MAG: hypothetical protein RQ760_03680 [Sedimentisphaerales bacterium]|nr:hypothetical protein [Sedimentisphaerales bacterium]
MFILLSLTMVCAGLTAQSEVENRIKPYDQNPIYWQYKEKPVVLIGGSFQDNPFQWAGINQTALQNHLDILKNCGGNYIRNTISARRSGGASTYPLSIEGMAWAFHKQMDGRFDLETGNDEYLSRLITFLSECQTRNIIVQLEFMDAQDTAWEENPWHPQNNINLDGYNPGWVKKSLYHLDGVHDPKLGEIQRKWIQRVLDITLRYDNILYQISNENGADYEWSDYWAHFIRDIADQNGKLISITDSRRYHNPSYYEKTFQNWEHKENRHPVTAMRNDAPLYNFLDISQNGGNVGDTHYENLIWYRNQVLAHHPRPINHTKLYSFIWPTGMFWGWDKNYNYSPGEREDRAGWRMWRTIFGGAAGVRFHRNESEDSASGYTNGDFDWGIGLNPLAQTHIKSMRMFLDEVNIFTMEPRNDLIIDERQMDESFVLAEMGKQYAIYFTYDQSSLSGSKDCDNQVVMTLPKGTYSQKWLDILDNSWMQKPNITSSGTLTINTANKKHMLVLLTLNIQNN